MAAALAEAAVSGATRTSSSDERSFASEAEEYGRECEKNKKEPAAAAARSNDTSHNN